MFDWTEEHKQIRSMLRQFIKREIEPHNDAMESGALLPYDLMRKLGGMIGLGELSKAALKRAQERREATDGPRGERSRSGGFAGGQDPYLAAALTVELSRCNPGFTLAFGAALGLTGQTLAARGTLEQVERWATPVLSLEKIGAKGKERPAPAVRAPG